MSQLSLPTHRISSSPKFLELLLFLFTWHLANASPLYWLLQFTTFFKFMPHLVLGQRLVSEAFSMPFNGACVEWVLKNVFTQLVNGSTYVPGF